ncbi:MAG: stage II sporulation protein P [Bacillota bacterium]|nr:stage II sporulation protein P [Bacillota bacterium]
MTGNEGTVRNVGDALAEELKSKGITVYHDKTLHDNPTYTNSYGRSLNTAKSYLGQHGEIKVVIDLHRDAMAEGGKKYSTAAVNGANASSFNVVVGRQNNNYPQLMSFAGKVIAKANELYPGLGGRIIEREYKFNQYLSNNYLLLEIGNNGNTIDEAVLTGKLLADVLEAVMREI